MMSKNKVMIKYILLGSVLAILIFSSSVTNPMLANGEEEEEGEDDDDDGVSDDEEKQNERNLSVEVSDKEAQITSRIPSLRRSHACKRFFASSTPFLTTNPHRLR